MRRREFVRNSMVVLLGTILFPGRIFGDGSKIKPFIEIRNAVPFAEYCYRYDYPGKKTREVYRRADIFGVVRIGPLVEDHPYPCYVWLGTKDKGSHGIKTMMGGWLGDKRKGIRWKPYAENNGILHIDAHRFVRREFVGLYPYPVNCSMKITNVNMM